MKEVFENHRLKKSYGEIRLMLENIFGANGDKLIGELSKLHNNELHKIISHLIQLELGMPI